MIHIDDTITASDLLPKIQKLWQASAAKIDSIDQSCPPSDASPVFTVNGKYTTRGWTEWTQGFQFGSAILQFDATGDQHFLEMGTNRTLDAMAPHLTHVGVHDHGFNNVSTYGNIWRLIKEGRIDGDVWQRHFCELALKITGAVQAARWSQTINGTGYIYSFNGPQSLFIDTIRSCRALSVSHMLGHALMGELDQKISLLGRMIEHATNTAKYNIYYGQGRDSYDTPDECGRSVHESIFNVNNGDYRCPSTQQGYSPFSTWTRGQAWAICGYPEQLEYLQTCSDEELEPFGGRAEIETMMLKAAVAVCEHYINHSPTDGIPYWDTGAPNLHKLGDWASRTSDPFNEYEPIDSSAAAIASQGLIRLGVYLKLRGDVEEGAKYYQAGLTVLDSLFDEPYLSMDERHQGLILHSIYHRPNGWDDQPDGQSIPCGQSSMWGDYHAREVALYVQRLANDEPYYCFFGAIRDDE